MYKRSRSPLYRESWRESLFLPAECVQVCAPPHGASPPAYRMVMLLAAKQHPEVIAFPMNQKAQDSDDNAPSNHRKATPRTAHQGPGHDVPIADRDAAS
jgi:aspartyl-tRNA synthetase